MPRRHSPALDLREALTQPGCPICRLVTRLVARYLASLAYENVNDLETRARLRRAHGFCNRHAGQFVEQERDALGTAIIYQDILRSVCRQLSTERGRLEMALTHLLTGRPRPAWLAATEPDVCCPACMVQGEAEARHLLPLIEGVAANEPNLTRALARNGGLCLPHLAQALGLARRPAATLGPALAPHPVAVPTGTGAGAGEGEVIIARAGGARGVRGTAFPVEWSGLPAAPAPGSPSLTSPPTAAEACGLPAVPALPPLSAGAGAGCPLCGAGRAAVDRRLVEGARASGRSPALCPAHLWRLHALNPDLAIDAARTALDTAREDVHAPARRHGPVAGQQSARRRGCPVCAWQLAVEERWWQGAAAFDEPDRSAPCLVHLRQAGRVAAADLAERARAALLARARRLDVELAELIRKSDYRFRGEPRGAEQAAWTRAVAAVAGLPGIR